MTKLNSALTVILVLSLAAVPIMYMVGMQRYSDQLDDKVKANLEQMRQENEQLATIYEATLKATLAEKEGEWDRQQEELRAYVRELLLNSGVPLEQLDPPPPAPEGPDMTISQETYESLEKGQSYTAVVELVGREGNNVLNMEGAEGKTSVYEWDWKGEEKPETMTVTFVNDTLDYKTYSAFKF